MGNITNAERARRAALARQRREMSQTLAGLAILFLILAGLFSFARKHPIIALPLYLAIGFSVWQFVVKPYIVERRAQEKAVANVTKVERSMSNTSQPMKIMSAAEVMDEVERICLTQVLPLQKPWQNGVPLYKSLISGTTYKEVIVWAKQNGINDLKEEEDTRVNIGKRWVVLSRLLGKTESGNISFLFAVDPFEKVPQDEAKLVSVNVTFSRNLQISEEMLRSKYSKTHTRDEETSKEGFVKGSGDNPGIIIEWTPEVFVNDQTTVIIEVSKRYEVDETGKRKLMSVSSPNLYIIDTKLFHLCHALEVAVEKAKEDVMSKAQLH